MAMNLLKMAKTNEVKFDLANYVILLRGEAKSGKTTFYSQVVKELYNDTSKGLLIPFEKGYSAIQGVNVFPETIIPSMVINGQPMTGWKVFTEIVDEVCQLKGEDKINIVCIDTVDEFLKVAEAEVCKLSRIKTKKPCESVDSAFGGFARGKKYLANMVKEQIEKLRNANVGIVFIGHTKIKTLKTKIEEQEYNILGSSLTEDYDRIFANDADFILMITQENHIHNGVMTKGERFLRFRGDGFYNAGSRFHNVPEKIQLSARGFVDTLKKAVMEINEVKDVVEYETKVEAEFKASEEVAVKSQEEIKSLVDNMVERIKAFIEDPSVPAMRKQEFKEACLSRELNLREPYSNEVTAFQEVCGQFGLV